MARTAACDADPDPPLPLEEREEREAREVPPCEEGREATLVEAEARAGAGGGNPFRPFRPPPLPAPAPPTVASSSETNSNASDIGVFSRSFARAVAGWIRGCIFLVLSLVEEDGRWREKLGDTTDTAVGTYPPYYAYIILCIIRSYSRLEYKILLEYDSYYA